MPKTSALARVTDWFKASSEELESLERRRKKGPNIERIMEDVKESLPGLSPGGIGAILKPVAIKKVIAAGLGKKAEPWLKGLRRIPQKELDLVEDVVVTSKYPKIRGGYHPPSKRVFLSDLQKPLESTVWHEVAHARQYLPKGKEIIGLSKSVKEAAKRTKLSSRKQYSIDPHEVHARSVAKVLTEEPYAGPISPEIYNKIYEELFRKSMLKGRETLKSLGEVVR